MTDPAEIRADLGDRDSLLAQARVWAREDQGIEALVVWLDELLADPAPVGLTEDERVTVDWLRDSGDPWDRRVLAIIDRLSAAPVDDREPSVTYTSTATRRTTSVGDDRDRVPEGWRVEWEPNPKCVYFKCPTGAPSHAWTPRLVPVSPSVDPEEGP